MSVPDEYSNLVSRIRDLTERGVLSWESLPYSTAGFRVDIGNTQVRLFLDETTFTSAVRFSIVNQASVEIASFQVPATRPEYKKVKALWDTARHQALRVEETISAMERRLEQLRKSDDDEVANA